MILIFFDETSDSKFKEYFGLSCVKIDSAHYGKVKTQFQEILKDSNWDTNIEFKGSYLFSAKRGDIEVDIDERIEIAEQILEINISRKNARINFYYIKKNSTDPKKDYLKYAPELLKKALTIPKHKNGKDIISINCDNRQDINIFELRNVFEPVLLDKEYTLLEDINMPTSGFETVGILYADIVGYLVARVDTISNDSELFEDITPDKWENNGKIKKLKSSNKLLKLIKNLNLVNLD